MARIISLIQYSGKLGNTIGRKSRKGNPILSFSHGKPRNPNTTKQVQARVKFCGLRALAAAFGDALAGLVRYSTAKAITPFNAFMHVNKDAVSVGEPVDGKVTAQVDFSALMLSKGSLVCESQFAQPVVDAEHGTVTIKTTAEGSHADRTKTIVLFDEEAKTAMVKSTPYSEDSCEFEVADTSHTFHAYLYETASGDEASTVAYRDWMNGSTSLAEGDIAALLGSLEVSNSQYQAVN